MGTCHSAGIVQSSSSEKATFQHKKKFKLTKKLNKTVPRIKKIFKKPEKLDKSTSFNSSFSNTVSIKDQYFEEEIEEIYENINIVDINNDLPHIKIDVKPNIVEIEEYDNSSSNNFSLIDDTDTPSPFPLVIHPSIESTDIESIHIMTTMSSSRSAPNSQIPAVNRFGFKSTTTANNLSSATTASTTSNTAQINKTSAVPTSPTLTASTGIQIKRLNSNFTELNINTNEKNDINTNKSNEKIHNGSPPRSFLKPPNPVVLNQNSTAKNMLKPTIPTLINRSPTTKQSNSSSLSSLSSTSSSLSITKLNENEPQKANAAQVKKQLKYATKPEAKPKMLTKSAKKSPEPNSKSNNENTKISTQPKQYEQMQEQEPQHNSIPIISNHKRILFKPYQLNINHNTNSNNTNVNSSNSTNQSSKSNNVAMQKENANETSNSNENTSQQQPQQKQFQSHLKQPLNLFTQLKGFKFGSNINNNSESKLKFYSKTSIKATKNEETNKVIDNATSSNTFMSHNSQLLGNASSIIKKEDSAYCSSTSSTVSSQDVDGGFSKEEKLNDFQMTMTKSTTNINSDSNNSNCEDDHLEIDSSKNKKESLKVGSEMNTEEEFNQEDYIEDNYMMQNLKQTLINLDSSAAKQNEAEICNFESIRRYLTLIFIFRLLFLFLDPYFYF